MYWRPPTPVLGREGGNRGTGGHLRGTGGVLGGRNRHKINSPPIFVKLTWSISVHFLNNKACEGDLHIICKNHIWLLCFCATVSTCRQQILYVFGLLEEESVPYSLLTGDGWFLLFSTLPGRDFAKLPVFTLAASMEVTYGSSSGWPEIVDPTNVCEIKIWISVDGSLICWPQSAKRLPPTTAYLFPLVRFPSPPLPTSIHLHPFFASIQFLPPLFYLCIEKEFWS